MVKLIVVSTENEFAAGLTSPVGDEGNRVVCALGSADELQPDIIILLQSACARTSLVDSIARARASAKTAKVVVLLERPSDVLECAKLKVDGIVVSSPQLHQLLNCIDSVKAGERWVDPRVLSPISELRTKNQASLTSRERQIVNCVIRGLRNKEIARELNLRESTVKMHLHHIFDKLKLANRTQLALAFSEPEDGAPRKSVPAASLQGKSEALHLNGSRRDGGRS